jgi:hypothetical protein
VRYIVFHTRSLADWSICCISLSPAAAAAAAAAAAVGLRWPLPRPAVRRWRTSRAVFVPPRNTILLFDVQSAMGGEFAAAVYAAGFRLTSAVVAGESPGARSISGRQLLPFRVRPARALAAAAAVIAAEPLEGSAACAVPRTRAPSEARAAACQELWPPSDQRANGMYARTRNSAGFLKSSLAAAGFYVYLRLFLSHDLTPGKLRQRTEPPMNAPKQLCLAEQQQRRKQKPPLTANPVCRPVRR